MACASFAAAGAAFKLRSGDARASVSFLGGNGWSGIRNSSSLSAASFSWTTKNGSHGWNSGCYFDSSRWFSTNCVLEKSERFSSSSSGEKNYNFVHVFLFSPFEMLD